MRHFTTLSGEALGTTMAGGQGKGRQLLQTKGEESLMWNLDEDTLCLEDDCHEWRLGDLMDFFLTKCNRLTKDEFLKKGWKESRWEQGLSMQTGTNDKGDLFFMR